MLVKMRKQLFESLEDRALPMACFEPLIPFIRAKDQSVKTSVYKQLRTGQQRLFMFNAYYNHAKNSLTEFYWWTAYYQKQPRAWSEFKTALEYFEIREFLQLMEKMEWILNERMNTVNVEVSYNDLDHDPKLLLSVESLYNQFNSISVATLQIIGKLIRETPNDFVDFEEEGSL